MRFLREYSQAMAAGAGDEQQSEQSKGPGVFLHAGHHRAPGAPGQVHFECSYGQGKNASVISFFVDRAENHASIVSRFYHFS